MSDIAASLVVASISNKVAPSALFVSYSRARRLACRRERDVINRVFIDENLGRSFLRITV